jgi:capsular exopolysaccharide synthesis family protein
VGNVWEAMKKHQAEAQQQARQETAAPDAPVSAKPPKGAAEQGGVAAAVAGNNYAEVLLAHHDRGGRIAEQYRALRTNLLAQYHDERFCIEITSAEGNEGKTVSCLNLALVLAERQERRTIVVDCDLRKGKIASYLNSDDDPGVADLLRGQVGLKAAVRPTAYANLSFIPAGHADDSQVGDLIGRPEMNEIVSELRRQYDYVLFDAPPVNVVADASALGRAIGEALLVVRLNKTHRESVDRAIRILHAANVKVRGIVLTHQKYYIPNYLYRYS